MRTASSKLDTAHLTANEEAELRCHTALELHDQGDYDGAREAMFPLWKRIGNRPNTEGLSDTVAAEVLLTTGILTRWLGNRSEIKEADGYAKDLISESITLYEAIKDSRKVAEARTELAYCYWRVGAHDEARILFSEALKRLTIGGNARANAIIGLSFVEWAESRHNEALKVLTENAPLFEKSLATLSEVFITIRSESYLKKSARRQESEVLTFNAPSMNIAAQMNNSN